MVARLKLKEIDGRAHQEWSLRLNLTTRGILPSPDRKRIDRLKLFLDFLGGGAWPFVVGGVICLLNCVNERDLSLLNSCANLLNAG